MAFFLNRIFDNDFVETVELTNVYTKFGDVSAVPRDTTFTDVTIQGRPDFPLAPGDTRSVQLYPGVAGTGTVAIAALGNTVIGVGTLFLSQLVVGSYIRIPSEGQQTGAGPTNHRVATITNDTLLTIEDSLSFNPVLAAPWVAITAQGSIVTLTGPATQVTGSFGNVAVPQIDAGDATKLVFLQITKSGSLGSFDGHVVMEYVAGTTASLYALSTIISYSFTPPVPSFFGDFSEKAFSATSMQWPRSGTFSHFVVRLTSNPFTSATETMEAFLQINDVDTLVGVASASVMPGDDTVTRNDVNTVAVSAGDLVLVRFRVLSGGASEEEEWKMSIFCVFEP